MIRLIEAHNYRCLKQICQPLDRFHVLVGPNGSGKTTFLDVMSFLSNLVLTDLITGLSLRTPNFFDFVWGGDGEWFELAVELDIPEARRQLLKESSYDVVRYEVTIGIDKETQQVSILAEKVLLKRSNADGPPGQLSLFADSSSSPDENLLKPDVGDAQVLISRDRGGFSRFSFHSSDLAYLEPLLFKLSPHKSALANQPDDESNFPVAAWLKGFLSVWVQPLVLNSQAMRNPSPQLYRGWFRTDGSNLPWVIQFLIDTHPERYKEWIGHLRTAIPDLVNIQTVEKEEDRSRYLKVRYNNNVEVPSWMVSDGTLRLLALTLLAYIPDLQGIFLIEEPENGIHPLAVETAFQSLSSVYEAQVLLATHSPLIVTLADLSQVLCFTKNKEGATEIVRGDEHRILRHWKGETSLGTLFASGVLG